MSTLAFFSLQCPVGAVLDRVEEQHVVAVLGASGVRLVASALHGTVREGAVLERDRAGRCVARVPPHAGWRELRGRLRALGGVAVCSASGEAHCER